MLSPGRAPRAASLDLSLLSPISVYLLYLSSRPAIFLIFLSSVAVILLLHYGAEGERGLPVLVEGRYNWSAPHGMHEL